MGTCSVYLQSKNEERQTQKNLTEREQCEMVLEVGIGRESGKEVEQK